MEVIIWLIIFFFIALGITVALEIIKEKVRAIAKRHKMVAKVEPSPAKDAIVYYDYEFSADGNHFTISALCRREAWSRARKLVDSSNSIFLIKTTGPHCKIRTKKQEISNDKS